MVLHSFISKLRSLLALLFVVLVSCSKSVSDNKKETNQVLASKVDAEAPNEFYSHNNLDSLNAKISYITVPFELDITEIERQINDNFSGLIFDDDSFEGDDLKVKIWKKDNLNFRPRGNGIFDFKVPLKIWVEKRISVFGVAKTPAADFEIIANFSSKPFISSNWELKSVTNSEGFEWVTQPKLSLGGFSIPITGLVETVLNNYQSTIARLIDESVAKEVNIKTPVLNTWNKLKEPFQISDDYNMWLQVVPKDILMTELLFNEKSLKTSVAIKATVNSSLGKNKTSIQKSTELPPLKFANTLPDGFGIHLYNLVTFSEAEQLAKAMFIGQKFKFKGERELEVLDVGIYGTEKNKLVIRINTTGDLQGTLFLKGDPVYDEVRREIILKNTEIDLKTKDVLAKAASWLMEGSIERQLEKEFGIAIDPIFEMAKTSMDQLLNSKLDNGIMLKGELKEINPGQVYLRPEGLMTTVEVNGKVKILLKKNSL